MQPRSSYTYLRRHYFDDEKLKRLALREFVRAMRSARLVAFVGSMITEPLGYLTWSKLLDETLELARKNALKAPPIHSIDPTQLVKLFEKVVKRDESFDKRVAFSAVAQLLDHISDAGLSEEVAEEVAKRFRAVKVPKGAFHSCPTTIETIFEELQIERVVTTNYDLELEAHTMQLGRPPRSARDLGKALEDSLAEGVLEQAGRRITRRLPNSEWVVSDVMERERPEGLIEFAIGCPEIDKHIFHLHGRADDHRSMILSYRDYDRLYRRRGLGKASFEHALRILFAGNPVIFIGLGMTEPELNATLAEFVGNHPYLRRAPAFLIWNAPPAWGRTRRKDAEGKVRSLPPIDVAERKAAFRLDKLHRLGMLTIFSDDFGVPAAGSADKHQVLRQSLISLRQFAKSEHDRRLKGIPANRWRHYSARARAIISRPDRIIHSWDVHWPPPGASEIRHYQEALPNSDNLITVLVRAPGDGNSARCASLAESWAAANPDGRVLLIDFNLRVDTDSILAIIATVLRYDPKIDKECPGLCGISREELFRSRDLGLASGEPLLIILRSIERIFDVNGHPLSAEFDQFLRAIVEHRPNFRIVAIGTERIRAYFNGLKAATAGTNPHAIAFQDMRDTPRSPTYLKYLRGNFPVRPLANIEYENRSGRDYATQRRSVYRALLSESCLSEAGVRPAGLALDVLITMSLIGQPIEPLVLFHAPRVRKHLRQLCRDDVDKMREELRNVFLRLEKSWLISEVNPDPAKDWPVRRYAVHLSLQSEVRDRNGIPLSDSILSTAYNMSLFAAQPADGALPEVELHEELGHLVDWLLGAHKEEPLIPSAKAGPGADRGARHVVSCFRAAFALIRGLYSTSAFLSVDRGDRLVGEESDGLLTQHAERLGRLLEAFEQICEARGVGLAEGAEPLIPDELVWLHNERGVVKLVQGDLYEARFCFDEAERINQTYVEFGDRSHNWRRITLNQLVVDIERGRLQGADDRMNLIEKVLGEKKTSHFRSKYLEHASEERIGFDPILSHEDILALALITSYRGLISHLRGELEVAKVYFGQAIKVLQRMDEQRALAMARRHNASLFSDLGDLEGMKREVRLAIAGSESVRQLDIVYTGQLLEACRVERNGDPVEKKRALRLALQALEYATLADLQRLAIQAQNHLARVKLASGDYEAALEHITDAILIATRNGMSLYKSSLRTVMGQILIKRGNPESGSALIRSAINGSVRIGYQRSVENARRALAEADA